MEVVHDQKYMMRFYHREEQKKLVNNERNREEDAYISDVSTSSFFDNSSLSEESSSSELIDDDTSSSSSNGPLYRLSELVDQLPLKRGLSKFYQGKSQSFTTLGRVTSLEDLVKKETPYQRRLKACKSYGGGLNNFRSYSHPKPTISKKISKPSLSNLSSLTRKNSFVMGS